MSRLWSLFDVFANINTMHRPGVDTLLAEFDEEMASTRRLLDCVPDGKWSWKPQEKASTLAKLASHLAFIPTLPSLLINMRAAERPADVAAKAELLDRFDRNAATGRAALDGLDEEGLARKIPIAPGISKPLSSVLRKMVMSHLIHHRGQLSAYLRFLGESVPGMYGPSIDEKPEQEPR